jgi:hypothetical protein
VAKSELKAWPLIGPLATAAGTLYIERASSRDALRVVHHMAERLQAGDVLAVFPEGTTGDGVHVLPFHANLLQAAIAARAPAQAVGLWLFTSSPMGAAPAAASAVAPSAAPNAASRAAPPKPCACTWPGCDKRFRDNYILTRHMLTHTGVRPFVCTWAGCVACFSQQGHLTTHMLTHTGVQPFVCNWVGCNKRFSRQGDLTEQSKRNLV